MKFEENAIDIEISVQNADDLRGFTALQCTPQFTVDPMAPIRS